MRAGSLLNDVRPVYRGTATVPTVVKTTATTPFGIYIELLMERAGYNTPAALARATGITDTTISRWLQGKKTPTISNLRALAPVLDIRLGDLMIQAGLVTAAEVGQAGAAPPPLPPVVREILRRLGPKSPLTEGQKLAMQNYLFGQLEEFDSILAGLLADVAAGTLKRRA
jgi:transcriptional regulator with XRE-family HTH domain